MKNRPAPPGAPPRSEEQPQPSKAAARLESAALSPATVATLWIFAGFLLAYVLFQIFPVYLNNDREMKTLTQFYPMKPIGRDLYENMRFVRAWFVEHQTSYKPTPANPGYNMYPPLETLLFGPFLLLDSSLGYLVLTALTLACFLLMTAGLPLALLRERSVNPVVLLVTVAGLASTGLAFELERGQYNVITMALCLGAIYLFHRRPRWRIAAYVMFTLAVQLKLYPAIFILMLVDDWHDWKAILKRFALIGGMNFLCLFALGPTACLEFLDKLRTNTAAPLIWNGNHSIAAYAELAAKALGLAQGAISVLVLALYAAVMAALLGLAWLRRSKGLNPHLLLGCTIGALIIPSISHDYTLSYLAAPVAVLLTQTVARGTAGLARRLGQWVALLVVSFAYFATNTTIFSKADYAPLLFCTHTPMLLLLLLGTLYLGYLDQGETEEVAAS